ncbi:calcium-binding protein [Pararhizobium arenae]|uniref:calcium-binding protein n=1 Tax=Pararhizobium arenae TaxID=1856850 RepID=UPI00094AC978|nr:calcium-binding protein [Pararhizobium arenae]
MRFSLLHTMKDSIWWDTIEGTSAADMIEIGFGNDTVYGRAGDDVIWDKDGAHREDIWLGSDDTINGGSGDDLIFAGWGSDKIDGGSGRDTLDYRYSRSSVTIDLRSGTGSGNNDSAAKGDRITGIEEVHGSNFNDIMIAGTNQTIYGDKGNDTLKGGTGASQLEGDAGNDLMIIMSSENSANGGIGYDTADFSNLGYGIAAGYSASRAIAEGFDARRASAIAEKIIGTDFDDYIHVGAFSRESFTVEAGFGRDHLIGGGGNDILRGGAGRDWLEGGDGSDRLYGGSGDDELEAGYGGDRMFGESGRDELIDGPGDDHMDGGAGNDLLRTNVGEDTLIGGSGADTFQFESWSQYAARATISDFNRAVDIIDLSDIDANTNIGGNQAFIFDATGSGAIGTLSAKIVGNNTVVSTVADIEGSFVLDMEIVLKGKFQLTAADFIL